MHHTCWRIRSIYQFLECEGGCLSRYRFTFLVRSSVLATACPCLFHLRHQPHTHARTHTQIGRSVRARSFTLIVSTGHPPSSGHTPSEKHCTPNTLAPYLFTFALYTQSTFVITCISYACIVNSVSLAIHGAIVCESTPCRVCLSVSLPVGVLKACMALSWVGGTTAVPVSYIQ